MTGSPSDPSGGRRLKGPTRSKSCQACKARKTRCSGFPAPCTSCAQRGQNCVFGNRKVPCRRNVNRDLLVQAPSRVPNRQVSTPTQSNLPDIKPPLPQHTNTPQPDEINNHTGNSPLYIDSALFGIRPPDSVVTSRSLSLKGNGLFSSTYCLTFFSDSRLEKLSSKLRNRKVNDVVRRISTVIRNRVKLPDAHRNSDKLKPQLDNVTVSKYISVYFDRVHPLYPHLDRASFESRAYSPHPSGNASQDQAFSALYHSVLALGCLHDGGGNFEPGKGKAWELFSVSLELIPELVQGPHSLTSLQALTTAAVYSLGVSCLAVEYNVMKQAARVAQELAPVMSDAHFRRTFWVLYSIEKMSSFYFGRSSTFVDVDIVTPLPHVPESMFGSLEWTLTFARHSRLLSRALTSLFSAGICQSHPSYYIPIINQLHEDLDQWLLSIPEEFRPGPSSRQYLRRPATSAPAMWINYLYYSFRLILLRTYLQVTSDAESGITAEQRIASREASISVSRSILEMVTYIEAEPCTPLWLLAGIPLCALFVLFDQVIDEPHRADTRSNLALLDIAGGHFSRIEYVSEGSLPGSLIAEFAYIARDYVNEVKRQPLDLSSLPPNGNGAVQRPNSGSVNPNTNETMEGYSDGNNFLQPISANPTTTEGMSAAGLQNLLGQDSWITEDDLLLGTDVMGIFGGIF